MGPSSTRDLTRVHAMEIQGIPYSKEISCATISQEDQNKFFVTLLLEFMPHKTTITGDTYATIMVDLLENIKLKRRGKPSAGVLLPHDNAPAHKSRTSRDAIKKCGFVELNHPSYSPDLAPSDYFLFRNLKKISAWATIFR